MSFEPFPKIGRLTRECVITEKIDGTNAQVNVVKAPYWPDDATVPAIIARKDGFEGESLFMFAGSRTRYVTPEDDNYGFAAWVKANADELFTLGPGRHFGEWWGQKIQRVYGLTDKRFSLFNTTRWIDQHDPEAALDATEGRPTAQLAPACCYVVPELYRGMFSDRVIDNMLAKLRAEGSVAAPGFMNPEGVVAFHTATGVLFKKTLEKDEQPKGK